MKHTDLHDPMLDYRNCWVCYQALSAAFAELADIRIEEHDGHWLDSLVATLRLSAERHLKVVE